MSSYHLDHLQFLETEAIHVMREVAAEFDHPAIYFSCGKDSICLLRLAEKAFRPSDIPMPLLTIETGDEHPMFLGFRNRETGVAGVKHIIRRIADLPFQQSKTKQNEEITVALYAAIEEFHFDCLIGGVRRDQHRTSAREHFFSYRDSLVQWNPRFQRPEVWNIYNSKLNPGEHMRVFPLCNWTKDDILGYIGREKLAMPNLNN